MGVFNFNAGISCAFFVFIIQNDAEVKLRSMDREKVVLVDWFYEYRKQ